MDTLYSFIYLYIYLWAFNLLTKDKCNSIKTNIQSNKTSNSLNNQQEFNRRTHISIDF